MKRIAYLIAAAALAGGCRTRPGELTQARVGITDGKKSINLESHKDTTIDEFARSPDGTITLRGYKSVANQGAIEASTQQFQMMNNLMMQNAEMLRQFGGLAAQYFSAGAVRGQPQVVTVTNYVTVPAAGTVPAAK